MRGAVVSVMALAFSSLCRSLGLCSVFSFLAIVASTGCGGAVDVITNDAGNGADAGVCSSPSAEADAESCEPFMTSGGRGGDMLLTWPCRAPLTPGHKSDGHAADDAFWTQCLSLCPKYGTPRLATCASSRDSCQRTTLFCEYLRL